MIIIEKSIPPFIECGECGSVYQTMTMFVVLDGVAGPGIVLCERHLKTLSDELKDALSNDIANSLHLFADTKRTK